MNFCKFGCGRTTENYDNICDICNSEFVSKHKQQMIKTIKDSESHLKSNHQISLGDKGKILFMSIHKKRYLIIILDRLVISSVSGIWRMKR